MSGELKRWFVYTNKGRKVTWAKSAEAAAAKGDKWGLTVSNVLPAVSLLEQMEGERQPAAAKPRGAKK